MTTPLVVVIFLLSVTNTYLSLRLGIMIGEGRAKRDYFKEELRPPPSQIRRELPRE